MFDIFSLDHKWYETRDGHQAEVPGPEHANTGFFDPARFSSGFLGSGRVLTGLGWPIPKTRYLQEKTRILEILNPDPEFRAGLTRPGENPARCPSLYETIKFKFQMILKFDFELVPEITTSSSI